MASKRDIDISSLCHNANQARKILQWPRQERSDAIQLYHGSHWQNANMERRPCNGIAQYVQVTTRTLISDNPRVRLSTFNQKFKPHVSAMESALNHKIRKMQFARKEQKVVLDALFWIGIGMVGLADPAQASRTGFRTEAGQPFYEAVDPDDWVIDPHARNRDEVDFVGYRARVHIDAVKDSRHYSSARRKLEPTLANPYNLSGDRKASMLQMGQYLGITEELDDKIDLWYFYLPKHNCIVTVPEDYLSGPREDRRGEALSYQDWLGPDNGPFHYLAYNEVPGNAIPVGPVQHIIDLDEAMNRTMRKLIRSADDYKEITTYRRGYDKDAKRVFDANHGDMVPVDDPDAIKTLVTTGQGLTVLPQIAAELQANFDRYAGNLSTQGGLAPQAKTATQENMLNQNSSGTVQDMQSKTLAHTQSVLLAIAWYEHYHPENVHRSLYSPKGYPQHQQVRELYPAGQSKSKKGYPQLSRDYDFWDMELEVDPFSMGIDSPEQQIAKIDDVLQKIIVPLMPILQQAGMGFNAGKYLGLKAKYINVPELPDIIDNLGDAQVPGAQGMDEQEQQGPSASTHTKTLPQSTNRTYTRQSGSEQTPGGMQRARMAQLSGVKLGGSPSQNGSA